MKKLLLALAVTVIAARGAAADTITGGGLAKVNHDASLVGSGTTPLPLGIMHCVLTGDGLIWNAGTSSWGCGSVGGTGSVTNVSTLAPLQGGPITTTGTVSLINCGANQIYKENGAGTSWACAADDPGVNGSLTSGKVPRATGTTSVVDGSWSDIGTALSETVPITFGGPILRTGEIKPTALTSASSTPNYNPTGLSSASIITQACTGGTTGCTITGLVAQPTGTTITLRNDPASTALLSLVGLSGLSLTANQFQFPYSTGFVLNPGYSVTLRYNGTNWQFDTAYSDYFVNLTVSTATTLSQLEYTTQTYSTTGAANNVVINNNVTVFKYTGAGAATITGFASTAIGRVIVVYNSTSNDLTLANMNGGSLSAQQLQNMGADVILHGVGSSATYVYETSASGPWRLVSLVTQTHPEAVTYTNALNGGTITLASGTGTATVTAGSHCTCTDQTANSSVKCATSSTTLTATGTGTDVITYLCF